MTRSEGRISILFVGSRFSSEEIVFFKLRKELREPMIDFLISLPSKLTMLVQASLGRARLVFLFVYEAEGRDRRK